MGSLEKRIEDLEQNFGDKKIEVWKDSYDGKIVTCSDGRALSQQAYRSYVESEPASLTVIHVTRSEAPVAEEANPCNA